MPFRFLHFMLWLLFHKDDATLIFDEFSAKVEKATERLTGTMVEVSTKAAAPAVLANLRAEAKESIEAAITEQAKKIGQQGLQLKKLRADLATKPHEVTPHPHSSLPLFSI